MKTSKKLKRSGTYVMFGFEKADIDNVGYVGEDLSVVDTLEEAKRFPAKKKPRQKDFASPEKWLEYINSHDDINQGFKFHLVGVIA